MDVKLLTFGKWHIPKSEGISAVKGQFNYVGLGCYDLVNISSVPCENVSGIFSSVYNEIKKKHDTFKIDSHWYIEQQIVLFSDEEDKFDKNKSFFVTLINSQYLSPDSTNPQHSFEEQIKTLFKDSGQEDKYRLYYTLDCADYVLIAQDMDIEVYCNIVNRLNFSNNICMLINDTATLYCLPMEMVTNSDCKESADDKNAFRVDFSIGVKNAEVISEIKADSLIQKRKPVFSGMNLGRDDYVVTMTFRDEMELAYVFCLFDRLSSGKESMITSFETEVRRIQNDDDIHSFDKPKLGFETLIDNVKSLFDDYYKEAYERKEKVDCITQIAETANSIIAILRGGCALSFLPCVYEPFCDFLIYSKTYLDREKMLSENDIQKYQAFCMSFLDKLKRLMFSTMHSNHHSIQVTTCNSFYFDVAPKLLSFYSIYMNDVAKAIGATRHTFMFSPDINRLIFLEKISPEKDEKNLVSVTLSEQSFYNPKDLINYLDHEVGHFVGKDMRKRGLRKECFVKIALYVLLSCAVPDWAVDYIPTLCDAYYDKIKTDDVFKSDNDYYSYDLQNLVPNIPLLISDHSYVTYLREAMKEAVDRHGDNKTLMDQFGCDIGIGDGECVNQSCCDNVQLASWLSEKICSSLARVPNNRVVHRWYGKQMDMIIKVLREGFSDVVMWVLGDIDEKEYSEYLPNTTMNCSEDDTTKEYMLKQNELRRKAVTYVIEHIEEDIPPTENQKYEDYQLWQIIRYLSNCRDTLKPDMSKCILSRDDINTIISFPNSKTVLDTITNGISKYINRLIADTSKS